MSPLPSLTLLVADLDEELGAIMGKMLARRPEARWSAAVAGQALDDWIFSQHRSAGPDQMQRHLAPVRTNPVLVTVGGAPLLATALPARYRARIGAVTTQGGYELCRLAVREGLLGQPLDGGPTLRARLSRAAERRRQLKDTIGDPASLRDDGATR